MLSYQHAYHAGNFADVHKHLWTYASAKHLLRKDSPITFIDTHAGRGSYPLAARETEQLKEYRDGVEPLWKARRQLQDQPLLGQWLETLGVLQQGERLVCYPGSPWWLGSALRDQDRLTLFELHPGEHRHLAAQSMVAPGHQQALRRVYGDGLAGLVKALPVATPRLCALIDPSYERKEEYLEVVETLKQVMRKARHGVVLVWYPLLPAGYHRAMLETLGGSGIRKIWRSEVCRKPPTQATHGMYGSGMLVINPPWGLDAALEDAIEHWLPLLGAKSSHQSSWLVAE